MGSTATPAQPAELYLVHPRSRPQGRSTLLDTMLKKQAADQRSRAAQMRAFWAVTLSAALDQEFVRVDSPTARNLRDLEQTVGFKAD